MAFQKSVGFEQGFGVPGDIHLESPTRAENLIINSNGKKNVYGYAFTKDSATNVAQVGGQIETGRVFAGILANPKEAVSYGTEKGPLESSLAIADHQHGDFVTMGDVVVHVTTQCKIGDFVVYDKDTGELSTVSDKSSLEGKELVPNAIIYRYPVTNSAGGLTIIRLSN
ncbi:structural cement protein Gp24 [Rodentibacter caecimuris]|uniref:structural cement protein Gp24 n=1 Tax=Rodentibacter caecimuris TaxID=1796644 RepID=UPI0013A0A9A7|nr:hypothetical protein [Rodentibacter heylii]QIA76169.1 hypothetical protein FEE42_01770 [Rodentibacter heylii]